MPKENSQVAIESPQLKKLNISKSVKPVDIEKQIKDILGELSDILKSDISYIGILQPDEHIKTLIVRSGNLKLPQQIYFISNSPDKNVIGKKIHLVKNSIAKDFPELTILFDKKIEAYLGIPLFSIDKSPIGIIVFYFFRSINSIPLSHKVLTAFGNQIAFLLELLPSYTEPESNSIVPYVAEFSFESIAQSIPDTIISIDNNYTIRFTNKNWLGLSINELTGKSLNELESNDYINIHQLKDHLESVFQNAKPLQFETQVNSTSGYVVTYKYKLTPYITKNQVKRAIITISDVTKERELEAQISESEEKYRNFINFSQEGIFLFALGETMDVSLVRRDQLNHLLEQLYLSECNFEFAQTYGYMTNTEPQGKSIIDFFGSKERATEVLSGFIDNNFTFSDLETQEQSHDGSERTMINNIFGVIKDNYLIEVWGTQSDITDKKASEAALQESFFKFKTLADYTYDWEYWRGPDNKYIYISHSCKRITGYSPDEFSSNTNLQNEIIYKDDQHKWNIHKEMSAKQIPCEVPIEFRIVTKQGKIKWINHVCRPVFDKDGNHLGNRGTNRDISVQKLSQQALRESEMHFKELADLTYEGILIHKYGMPKNVNKALLEMTGYSAKEFHNQNILNILLPDKEQAKLIITNNPRLSSPTEIEIKRKDGTLIPVEVVSRAISETEKNLIGTSFRDISEQKVVQQKVLKAIIQTEEQERKRIAQELHDGLGPVLSTIKLNTQTYINSNNDLLKEKLKNQLLSGIDDALNQTSSISNNISPHVLTDFGLKVAIQKFIEKLSGIENINITFEFDYMPQIDKEVEITLYRVSTELINNTLKHAKATRISLLIYGSESQIELNYSDNGIGFSLKEAKEKIGGMGLFNIINRIKSLNGKVHFVSSAPQGVSYTIIVPVKSFLR